MGCLVGRSLVGMEQYKKETFLPSWNLHSSAERQIISKIQHKERKKMNNGKIRKLEVSLFAGDRIIGIQNPLNVQRIFSKLVRVRSLEKR